MDSESLVDFRGIETERRSAEEEAYLDVIRRANGTIGSYEVALEVGIPAHEVYPRLLALVNAGRLEMPQNDEFRIP